MGQKKCRKENDNRDKYLKDFALRLSTLRSKAGVSAREMSSYLENNHTYINAIENAKTFPSVENFLEICKYLNTTPSEFFRYMDEESLSQNRRAVYESIALLTETQVDTLLSIINEFRK